MQASNITAEQLQRAADSVGVSLDMDPLNQKGTRHRVKVNPRHDGPNPYQRISVTYDGRERRVHAVCWHGFRDFFRAAFELAPDAKFRTAMDTWSGAADFEARFRDSGYRNIGSQMMPLAAAEACTCDDSGYAR